MPRFRTIAPLHGLIESRRGRKVPLPGKLARLYGIYRLPLPGSRAYVYSNFVTTLDGVVSLQVKGHEAGGDISGFDIQDRMVMGLLRAIADVVIVGSGTLAADPDHIWTPAAISPELADDFRLLREKLRKPAAPLNVVVSASGKVDLRLPVFAAGQVSTLLLTTAAGAKRLAAQRVPSAVTIRAVRSHGAEIPAQTILASVARTTAGKCILVEGGPRLLAGFYSERLLDEQFLTLAPQIAGRSGDDSRPSFVMGHTFAPRNPLWGTLIDARRGERSIFLRYSFRQRPR
jgi:riboflavin biosynthesis pyrimidine reductase